MNTKLRIIFVCMISLAGFVGVGALRGELSRLRLTDVIYLEDYIQDTVELRALDATLLTFGRDGSNPIDHLSKGQRVRILGLWEDRYLIRARVTNGGAEGWVVKSDFESFPADVLKRIQERQAAVERIEQAIARGEVELGMTDEDVMKVWGKPKAKSSVQEAGGRFEQWTFHSYRSIPYFTSTTINGTNIVTTLYRKIPVGTKVVTFQAHKVIRIEQKEEDPNLQPSGGTIVPPVIVQ